jgi:uncharacterized membrane protein HdeD (DUF308 family)
MIVALTQNWWALVLRGLCALVFGFLALFMPGQTLVALIWVFGIFALVNGFFSLISGFRGVAGPRPRWPLWINGILGIGAGVVTLAWPAITAVTLLYLIAFWAIITGFFEIIAAFHLRKDIKREWLLGLTGVFSIIFGILLIASPGTGMISVVWLIGVYAIMTGSLLFSLGLRLRTHKVAA